MRSALRSALAIGVLAIAVVAFAPASLVDAIVSRDTSQHVRLSHATGFWWRGRGTLVIEETTRFSLAWQVALPRLLQNTLVIDLFDAERAPIGTVTVNQGKLDVREFRAQVPATLLTALDRSRAPVVVGGAIKLDVPQLTIHGATPSGTLRATWDRARIVVGDVVVDLGVVSLATIPSDGGISGTVQNAGGDVVLTGTLTSRNGQYDVALRIRPTSATPEPVRAMLPLLGPPDNAGGVHVSWSNRL
jgi:hypothetical protein